MTLLRMLTLLAALAAAGCGGRGVSSPAKVSAAPDKTDKGLKGDTAPGPP